MIILESKEVAKPEVAWYVRWVSAPVPDNVVLRSASPSGGQSAGPRPPSPPLNDAFGSITTLLGQCSWPAQWSRRSGGGWGEGRRGAELGQCVSEGWGGGEGRTQPPG